MMEGIKVVAVAGVVAGAVVMAVIVQSNVLQRGTEGLKIETAREFAYRNVQESCQEHEERFDERACMLARHRELMTRLERLERILLDTQRGLVTARE